MRTFVTYFAVTCLLTILLSVTVAMVTIVVNGIQSPAPTCPKAITPAITI